MSNPYQIPSPSQNDPLASNEVRGPAIALIIVSMIAMGVGVLGLAGDVLMVMSGVVTRMEEMNDGPISEYTQITVRIIWGILLLIAASYVMYGAIKMNSMTQYGTARAAAIVAMVPLVGPCCFLGIPFGIWAFSVLNKPHVRDAFR